MASFGEALVNSMISNMDPAHAMQQKALDEYLDTQRIQAKLKKAEAISRISQQIAELDPNTSPVVKTSLEKILAQLSE